MNHQPFIHVSNPDQYRLLYWCRNSRFEVAPAGACRVVLLPLASYFKTGEFSMAALNS